jgi:hypothetical protein
MVLTFYSQYPNKTHVSQTKTAILLSRMAVQKVI